MQFLIGRSRRGVGRDSRPLAVRIAIVALLAGLFGVISQYNAVQAVWKVVDAQQPGPNQVAACVAVGGIHFPVDAAGGAIRINVIGVEISPPRTPVHQLTLTEGGAQVNNFCLDISKQVLDGVLYCQVGVEEDVKLVYLIAKYPPTLDDRVAQAARQAAVWHYTNGITLGVPDATTEPADVDAAVLAAYNTILADVDANAAAANLPAEFLPGPPALTVLVPDVPSVLPGRPTQDFKVRLTNGGKPLVGITVNVTSSSGTLDKTSGVTDSQGEAAFKLTSNELGKATVTASATAALKRVLVYVRDVEPTSNQPLGSAGIDPQTVSAEGALSWIAPTSLEPDSEPRAGWLLFLPMLKD